MLTDDPTMLHLANLLHINAGRLKRSLNWASFASAGPATRVLTSRVVPAPAAGGCCTQTAITLTAAPGSEARIPATKAAF